MRLPRPHPDPSVPVLDRRARVSMAVFIACVALLWAVALLA